MVPKNCIKSTSYLDPLPSIRMIKLKRVRGAGHAAGMGEKRNAYRIFMGKPQRKRPLRRPRHWSNGY
jgi:hypothetical protein